MVKRGRRISRRVVRMPESVIKKYEVRQEEGIPVLAPVSYDFLDGDVRYDQSYDGAGFRTFVRGDTSVSRVQTVRTPFPNERRREAIAQVVVDDNYRPQYNVSVLYDPSGLGVTFSRRWLSDDEFRRERDSKKERDDKVNPKGSRDGESYVVRRGLRDTYFSRMDREHLSDEMLITGGTEGLINFAYRRLYQ